MIVKVDYCGICGSDITNFKFKMYQTPLIMGHEFAGTVSQIGENITDVQIGDKVCGINVSLDLNEGKLDGLGIFRDGGFAEYVKVPKKYLFPIPDNVSTKDAIMIESFANAVRGSKLSNITPNQNVLIIGGGNIGLTFLTYLLAEKTPNYIAVIEPQKFLRENAMEMGATEALSISKIKIRKFIKNFGIPSHIFDCAGNENSLLLAIDLIKKGGTIILEGIHKGNVSFPMFLLNSKEICLQGVLGHDRKDILDAIKFFDHKKVEASKFITKIVPLRNIQETFEQYLNVNTRDFIKIAIKV